jgi:hypothetical protein
MSEIPVSELQEEELEPQGDFAGRVRRSIERRVAGGQVATFSWELPKVVLRELTEMIVDRTPTVLRGKEAKK